jgi:hypothetical protein
MDGGVRVAETDKTLRRVKTPRRETAVRPRRGERLIQWGKRRCVRGAIAERVPFD